MLGLQVLEDPYGHTCPGRPKPARTGESIRDPLTISFLNCWQSKQLICWESGSGSGFLHHSWQLALWCIYILLNRIQVDIAYPLFTPKVIITQTFWYSVQPSSVSWRPKHQYQSPSLQHDRHEKFGKRLTLMFSPITRIKEVFRIKEGWPRVTLQYIWHLQNYRHYYNMYQCFRIDKSY
jgi:hypothetical protein